IRDFHVTGVQTCALPIYKRAAKRKRKAECGDTFRFFFAQSFYYACIVLRIPYLRNERHSTHVNLFMMISQVVFGAVLLAAIALRSEERRVGKEVRLRGGP